MALKSFIVAVNKRANQSFTEYECADYIYRYKNDGICDIVKAIVGIMICAEVNHSRPVAVIAKMLNI